MKLIPRLVLLLPALTSLVFAAESSAPKARIAGIALGHDAGSHDTAADRQLLKNTILWAAGRQH